MYIEVVVSFVLLILMFFPILLVFFALHLSGILPLEFILVSKIFFSTVGFLIAFLSSIWLIIHITYKVCKKFNIKI